MCLKASGETPEMGNTALLSEHQVWEDAVSALGSLHLQISLPRRGLLIKLTISQLFLGKVRSTSCPSS